MLILIDKNDNQIKEPRFHAAKVSFINYNNSFREATESCTTFKLLIAR